MEGQSLYAITLCFKLGEHCEQRAIVDRSMNIKQRVPRMGMTGATKSLTNVVTDAEIDKIRWRRETRFTRPTPSPIAEAAWGRETEIEEGRPGESGRERSDVRRGGGRRETAAGEVSFFACSERHQKRKSIQCMPADTHRAEKSPLLAKFQPNVD